MKTSLKTVILTAALTLFSPLTFAGNGGSLSCNSGDQVVAVYSFFRSDADSYSSVSIFVKDNNTGKYLQLDGFNEEALKPITVKTPDGRSITIAAKKNLDGCVIR